MSLSLDNALFLGAPIKDWKERYNHYLEEGQVLVNARIMSVFEFTYFLSDSCSNAPEFFSKDGKIKAIPHNWRYDQDGFVQTPAIGFKELESTEKREGTGNYSIELITKQFEGAPLATHSFIRLIDAEGRVYSVGGGGAKAWPDGYRKFRIMSPDPLEAQPNLKERVTPIEVSQEGFYAAIAEIEAMSHEKFTYHAFTSNCLSFAERIIKKADPDFNIDFHETIPDMIVRGIAGNMSPGAQKVVEVIVKIVIVLLSPLFWFAYFVMGYWTGEAKNLIAEPKPHAEENKFVRFLRNVFLLEGISINSLLRAKTWQDEMAKSREIQSDPMPEILIQVA